MVQLRRNRRRRGYCPIHTVLRIGVSLVAILYLALLARFFGLTDTTTNTLANATTNATTAFLASEEHQFATDQTAALDYVRSVVPWSATAKTTTLPLQFVHIPKTAGTAVEFAAGQRRMAWGSCVFPHKPQRRICPKQPHQGFWPDHIGWWHVPAQFFPLLVNNNNNNNDYYSIDPYQQAFLFGITRNPYQRLVSEYYYICTLTERPWRPNTCNRTLLHNADYFNAWLQDKLRQQQLDNKQAASSLLRDNGHFTRQYDFVVGPHEVRMLDYVLDMDNDVLPLQDQFAQLMAAFGLKNRVQLQKRPALGSDKNGTDNGTETQLLTVQQLHPETIDLIHQVYEKDFEVLGYSRIETTATT